MPKRYRLAVLAGAIALFAAPAVADGYAGKTYNRGPAPLQAHTLTPPEPGCYLVDAKTDTWSCPPLQQQVHKTSTGHSSYTGGTVRRYIDESKTRTYVNRYTTGGECCGDTRPAPPPPPRYVPPAPRPPVVVERGLRIDISGFGGGVGNGVDGGYYGGGGGFAYASASASSSASAMASASASLTFRGSFKGGGKKGGGGCHVCGGGGKKGGGGKGH
ncbi:MAG: hypothetical protein RLN72_15075 [Henriciella sp.]